MFLFIFCILENRNIIFTFTLKLIDYIAISVAEQNIKTKFVIPDNDRTKTTVLLMDYSKRLRGFHAEPKRFAESFINTTVIYQLNTQVHLTFFCLSNLLVTLFKLKSLECSFFLIFILSTTVFFLLLLATSTFQKINHTKSGLISIQNSIYRN